MDSTLEGGATVVARNVGGIDETSVEFTPGVTVLSGRNATNRTSLLRAIMAACGSDRVSVKADAEEASVELTVDGRTYRRTLTRRNGRIVSDGEPYLDDPQLADLFAFLLESNEARRAIERGEDIRDIVMRPVDTDEIESAIARLNDEKREIEAELQEIDRLEGRLTELEEERRGLDRQIEEKRSRLEEAEGALGADGDEADERETLETTLEELQAKRSELEEVSYDLETEQESRSSLREEQADLEAELADLPDPDADDADEIEAEIERLRARQGELDSELEELQSVIRFNQEMLEGARQAVSGLGSGEGAGESITDQLVDGETVSCWTCGTDVEREQVEATIDRLRELNERKVSEGSELDAKIADLAEERDEIRERRTRRRDVERRLERIEGEIEDRERRIDELRTRRGELESEIEGLEAEVEALESDLYDERLSLSKEASELEFELGQLENERRTVEDEIATVEDRLSRQEELERRREDVRSEIEELRTRVEQIENRAVDAFNEHMDSILELLGYENIERIWAERVDAEPRDGRPRSSESAIELHVVRSAASGALYEDTVDHLSESEREVTGLIFALAGYLAHDVHEQFPFILLDSLEAIDSGRIAALVEYLSEYCSYLIVALLPEDASELDGSYARIETV